MQILTKPSIDLHGGVTFDECQVIFVTREFAEIIKIKFIE